MPFHGSNRGSNPLGDAIWRLGRLPGLSWVRRAVLLPNRRIRLRRDFANGLPASFEAALGFVAWPVSDGDGRSVVEAVEACRRSISAREGDGVDVWYSPQPGSWTGSGSEGPPAPGRPIKLSWPRIAVTGKDRFEGTLLYLLARGFGSRFGLELGACAGLSARYMAAAPSMLELTTVEGSAGLCEVARETLRSSPNVAVIHASFSEAIDQVVSRGRQCLDLVFIDGHHERLATIHYFDRLRPCIMSGALVIFDDISWSSDMNLAWEELRFDTAFAHTLALGNLGVGVIKSPADDPALPPRQWDLSYLVPPAPIGRPWGWQ